MAYISKIKLPKIDQPLILKDADAQLMLTGFSKTSGSVKTYIDEQVAGVNFIAKVYQTLPTASEQTLHELALVVDAQAAAGTYIEYITVRSGEVGSYTYAWEQIGTTQLDLSGYVQKTTTIAGVDLQDNITKSELQTALELGSLAYKNNAKGSYDKATNGSVDIPTYEANFTYIGVRGDDNSTITVSNIDSYETSMVTVDSTGSVTPGVAAEFTQGTDTFTSATVSASFLNPGALPSFTEGTFTQGSLASLGTQATGTFAQSGLGATVGTGDDAETLIFSAAPTASAVTPGLYTNFNAGSLPTKAADTWSAGTLPSLNLNAFDGGSFAQGTDSFTPNTPTEVELPEFGTENITVILSNTTTTINTAYELYEASGESDDNVTVVSSISQGEAEATTVTITTTPTTVTVS